MPLRFPQEGGVVDPKLIAGSLAQSVISVARVREHGLAAAVSHYTGGEAVTAPFLLPHKARLTLNADTGAGGAIYVTLVNATTTDALAPTASVVGNGLRLPVALATGLGADAQVALHFRFFSAVKLFSFAVTI